MKKIKARISAIQLVLGFVLIAYSAVLLFLFVWAVINSFKSGLGFDISPVGFPNISEPDLVDFGNYVKAFKAVRMSATLGGKQYWIYFPEMLWNSVLYAIGCSFFATITPCLVAYVTSKYKLRINKVIYTIVIVVMVTPVVGSLPSQIQMVKAIGLFDSHVGLWLTAMTFLGTYYLVFYAIFKGLSWEYAEAAFIDGASHLTVMFRVMLPLVKNTFMVVMLLNFIARWNDYQTSWVFLPNRPTAAVGVQYFIHAAENKYRVIPIHLAASMMLLTPVLILFIIFRNKLVGNLTIGGIKG